MTAGGERRERRRGLGPVLSVLIAASGLALAHGSVVARPGAVGATARRSGAGTTRQMSSSAGPDEPSRMRVTAVSAPSEITSGVTYSSADLVASQGPERAHLLAVDLGNPNVALSVVLADDRLESGNDADEVLSAMADSHHAVAGVNGDYFFGDGRVPAPLGEGQPVHLLVEGGIVVHGLSLAPSPTACATLSIGASGRAVVGDETFRATVTADGSSYAIGGVNTPVYPEPHSLCGQAVPPPGLVLVTPLLGQQAPLAAPAPIAELRPIPGDPGSFTVLSVRPSVGVVPLQRGSEALVGEGVAGSWLRGHVHSGATVEVAESLAPDPDPLEAVGGGDLIVAGGRPAYGASRTSPVHALTAVAVTRGGHHLVMAVFDGGRPGQAVGVTHAEMAQYLIDRGAFAAVIFDSGGSSEMVARLPGEARASVVSTPSDGEQRRIAECLCLYSTAAGPGPASQVVVNGGRPLVLLEGTTVAVTSYALDRLGNPASGSVGLAVSPPSLGRVAGNLLTAARVATGTGSQPSRTAAGGRDRWAGKRSAPLRPGSPSGDDESLATPTIASGLLTGTSGSASSSVVVHVVGSLSSLSLSPLRPDLGPGASEVFSVRATARGAGAVDLPADAVAWSVQPPSLGRISATGVLTASASREGIGLVEARAGGVVAETSIAVGESGVVVDPMTDLSSWQVFARAGSTGRIGLASSAPPGASSSMDLHYQIRPGSGVRQIVIARTEGQDEIATRGTAVPMAVGLWLRGGSPGPSRKPLGRGVLSLAEVYTESNGRRVALYPSAVDFGRWTLVRAPLPVGLSYPLRLDYLDVLVISPARELSSQLDLADLESLYSVRS